MKFEIAKREVDVRWNHIALILSVILGVIITLAIISFAAGGFSLENFPLWSFNISSILDNEGRPVFAFLLLAAASLFKMKKDVAFCRSVAAANFVVFTPIFVYLLVVLTFPFPFLSPAANTLLLLENLLASAAGAILLYLWLLTMMKFEWNQLKKAVAYGLIFAISIRVAIEAIEFVFAYANSVVYAFEFRMHYIYLIAMYFLLGFPILYHTLGKKLDNAAAVIFGALYAGMGLIDTFVDMERLPAGDLSSFSGLAISLATLSLLYLLSRLNLNDITL